MRLLEVGQLQVRIFIDLTALHKVLRELQDRHEIPTRDLFVCAVHFHLLHDKHGQAVEQINVLGHESVHFLEPGAILFGIETLLLEQSVHLRDEQAQGFCVDCFTLWHLLGRRKLGLLQLLDPHERLKLFLGLDLHVFEF